MVNSNWKEKELTHHLVPLPEFHCFVFAEGEEEDEEGEGMNTQMLDHLQKISVHYLQQVCFAYYRANASHEHRQFGYSYYRQKNNLMPR